MSDWKKLKCSQWLSAPVALHRWPGTADAAKGLRMNQSLPALKRFAMDEAERCGITPRAVKYRVQRGQYAGTIRLHRINQRVVLVERLGTEPPACTTKRYQYGNKTK